MQVRFAAPAKPLTVHIGAVMPAAVALGVRARRDLDPHLAAAAVHAGWAGLEAGVVERAVAVLREESDGPVRAVLGPCIHADRYEFGRDLLDRLVDRFGPQVASRTGTGAPAFDIPAAVRAALAASGVDDVDDVDVCTAASPDHFSYRRDGVTGRQAMFVVRDRRARGSR